MVGGFPCENMRDALIVQPSFEPGQPSGLLDSHSQAQLNYIVKLVVCEMLPLFLSSPFRHLPGMKSSPPLNQSLHPSLCGNL